jgi:hypothetical protein
MQIYSYILFTAGLFIGVGCCLFVAAAIIAMVTFYE